MEQKTRSRKPYNKRLLFCLIIMTGLFMVNFGLALDFDNSKASLTLDREEKLIVGEKVLDYNPIWEKYAPLEIKNTFGLGETLFKGAITTHTESCGNDCLSIIEIEHSGGVLIEAIKFKTLQEDNSWINQNVRSYELKYLGLVPTYNWVCEKGLTLPNGTIENICNYVKNGEEEGLIKYLIGSEMPKGNYKLYLTANKRPSRTVDWIITTQGAELTEWATWGNISTGSQAEVRLISPTNNSIQNTTLINLNATGNVTGGAYLTNATLYDNSTGTWGARNTSNLSSSAEGIVSYYTLDESSGTVIDLLNRYNGTATNVTYSTTGKINTAYNFTGSNARINLTTFDINSSRNFSFSGWFRWNGTENQIIFGQLNNAADTSAVVDIWNFGTGAKLRFCGRNNESAEVCVNSSASPQIGIFQFFTATYNGNTQNLSLYLNSTLVHSRTLTYGIRDVGLNVNWMVGNRVSLTNPFYNGSIDEFGIWNKTLSSSEVSSLYNSGNGLRTNTAYTNYTSSYSNTYPIGSNIKWNMQFCDSDGACGFATSNFTFFVDNTAPRITLNSPTSLVDYGRVNGTLQLNLTANDTNLNKVWYNYNGTNITLNGALTGIYNLSNITLSTKKNITIYANDTAGNLNTTTFNWDYKVFENNKSYVSPLSATSGNNFLTNITYDSSNYYGVVTTLNYNGTNYTSTKVGTGNNVEFTNTINAPNVLVPTNFSLYWIFALTNLSGTTYVYSETYNQTINPLQTIRLNTTSCDSGFYPAFNFTFFDEENLSKINATTVQYNFQYGILNNTALTSAGSFNNIGSFVLCINASSEYYSGYGEIQYATTGYSPRRYYLFENTRLINSTINTSLYSLLSSSSTNFQITATSTTLEPYQEYFISLLRWYPNLNEYKIVEMGKTDDKGQTVLSVKTNDVDYRLGLYSPSGILIKLLNPIRMVCQTTPCLYSIITSEESPDLSTFGNIQADLRYDALNKLFTFIWNDPSQDTSAMNLLVYKDSADKESVIVCNETATGFTGILVCDASSYTGSLRAEAWRSASPAVLIAQWLEDVRHTFSDERGGESMGLFAGLVLLITFGLMGLVSPPLVVVLALIALVPMVALGVISFSVFMIIGALGGVVLHFLRRVNG